MSVSREKFERRFPKPIGVGFNQELQRYEASVYSEPSVSKYNAIWNGWQASRAQDGGEPVADFEIECDCGDFYRADSFGAGFIAGVGMCENCLTTHTSVHPPSAVVPEWIKCSERITENRCLAYTPNDDPGIMFRIVPARLLKQSSDVTHWMPLPQPPKKQEQES
jgi:hypothetical protein